MIAADRSDDWTDMRGKPDKLPRSNRIAAIAVALVLAMPATARPMGVTAPMSGGGTVFDPGSRTPRAFVAQLPNQRGLTLAEAVVIAQRRHPGRVVRSQTIQQGNGAVHEVRIIGNDGVVHDVRVDARTGAVQ
jgi:hypothetical protein